MFRDLEDCPLDDSTGESHSYEMGNHSRLRAFRCYQSIVERKSLIITMGILNINSVISEIMCAFPTQKLF